MTPQKAAYVGFLLVLPFFLLNFVVALRLEPIYSMLIAANLISSTPWFPTLLLALFPIALFIVIRPMLRHDAAGKRHFYILNSLLGVFILVVMIFLWGGLGEDIIKCDILKIPNCD